MEGHETLAPGGDEMLYGLIASGYKAATRRLWWWRELSSGLGTLLLCCSTTTLLLWVRRSPLGLSALDPCLLIRCHRDEPIVAIVLVIVSLQIRQAYTILSDNSLEHIHELQ